MIFETQYMISNFDIVYCDFFADFARKLRISQSFNDC